VLRRNAWSFVGDRQDPVRGIAVHDNDNAGPGRSVLDGVVDEVRNRIAQDETISDHGHRCRRLDAEPLMAVVGENRQRGGHLRRQIGKI